MWIDEWKKCSKKSNNNQGEGSN